MERKRRILTSASENETVGIAQALADSTRAGDVFLLSGELGAGKSVFARAFIRRLAGSDIEVPSPTFTLVQTYELSAMDLWHFDLYRLEEPEEIFEIGWEEALATATTLVEWPERLGPYQPYGATRIRIETAGDESRTITIDEQV